MSTHGPAYGPSPQLWTGPKGATGPTGPGGPTGATGMTRAVWRTPMAPDTMHAYRVCLMLYYGVLNEGGIPPSVWQELCEVVNGDINALPEKLAVKTRG